MLRTVAILCALAVSVPTLAHWRPEYAQATPEQGRWFDRQHIPGAKTKCCTTADGTAAQEDIRDGVYWTSFSYKRWDAARSTYDDMESGWMPVPANAVIEDEPNIYGRPVVWWYVDGAGKLVIRCYARGAGG